MVYNNSLVKRTTYTAGGVKIGRTSTDGISSDCTVYAGNLIYRNGLAESLLVEGGFIDLTGSSPAYRFYVTDHQGNIRVVTDASGTVLRTNHYDPYGEEVIPVLTSASTLPSSTAGTDAASRFMYGAKEWDREISLYDFSARYYSPAGPVSFTTMDPLCEKYYAISPYAYCAGNPVNIVDPNGMAFTKESQQYLYPYLNRITELFSEALKESLDCKHYLIDNNLSSFKRTRLEKRLERQNKIMTEMVKATIEYLILDKSSQVYDISNNMAINNGDNNISIEGITMFDLESSSVQIQLTSNSLGVLSHELKHAYQFEIGETGFQVKTGQGSRVLHDIYDEEEAFTRGRYFGGEAHPGSFYGSYPQDHRKIDRRIPPFSLQDIANKYGIIFRINGITYIGREN